MKPSFRVKNLFSAFSALAGLGVGFSIFFLGEVPSFRAPAGETSSSYVDPLASDPQEEWVNENGLTFYGPQTCTVVARKLSDSMYRYRVAAYLNKKLANYNGIHRDALAELEKIRETDPCYLWLNNFYVLLAVHSYGHIPNDLWISLHNVTASLVKQLRFRPLTRKLSDEWGGMWKSGPGKIVGAYQCEESLVYFDRSLRPFNLAAVIAHELEHVVRDKFSYWDRVDDMIHDVSTALLLDETLSVLHAGYSQLSFFRDSNRDSADKDNRKIKLIDEDGRIFAKKDQRHYTLGSDLNLYDRRGYLKKLWKRIIQSGGFPLGKDFSFFLDQAVLYQLPSRSGIGYLDEFSGIIELVSRAYFSGKGPSVSDAITELDRWDSIAHDFVSPLGQLQRNEFTRKSRSGKSPDSFFSTLEERLHGVSPGCKKIAAAIRGNQVRDYVGAHLDDDHKRPGGDGTRPGGDGTRPGVPLMPCLYPDEKI